MTVLSEILHNVKIEKLLGDAGTLINNVTFDSRIVSKSDLFVATRGTKTDGHSYIEQVSEKGATAIVCEDFPSKINNEIVYIKVKDSAEALGLIASNFYGNPSSKLKLVGVTGTNGKTTIASLLHRLFMNLGYRCGLMSTVRNYINDKVIPATHTTPDALQLNKLLSEMVSDGCDYCFMEVSSHSVAQHRISGLTFAGGIFTNITHDHLDYHKTFDEYIKAKKGFFDSLPAHAFALTNSDDKNGLVMLQNTAAEKKTYALKSFADFKCRIIESHMDGTMLKIDNAEVWIKLIGEFNAYNILAIYSTALLLKQKKEEILPLISNLRAVDGRFEYVNSEDGRTAIVDYAHTPDALVNVLNTINRLKTGYEQVITVVGAGGDRDKTKRPVMAKVAVEMSNKLILTSDNPRSERPEDILKDMEAGIELQHMRKVLTIIDRKEAIKTACMMANKGDIILVAGKGHENYQEINGVKYHFDDKEILGECGFRSSGISKKK